MLWLEVEIHVNNRKLINNAKGYTKFELIKL